MAYLLNTPEKQVRMLRTLLMGDAKNCFNSDYAVSNQCQEDRKIQQVLNEVAMRSFNDDSNMWQRQQNYIQ